MIYLIFYQQNNESRILEWVTPEGWNTPTIAEAFERQFPAAQLLDMEPQP